MAANTDVRGVRRFQLAAFLDVLIERTGPESGRMNLASFCEFASRISDSVLDEDTVIDLINGECSPGTPAGIAAARAMSELVRDQPALIARMYGEHPHAGGLEELVSLHRLTGRDDLRSALNQALGGAGQTFEWDGQLSVAAILQASGVTPHDGDALAARAMTSIGIVPTVPIDIDPFNTPADSPYMIDRTSELDALQEALFDISELRTSSIEFGRRLQTWRAENGPDYLVALQRMVCFNHARTFDKAAQRLEQIESGAPRVKFRVLAFGMLRAYDMTAEQMLAIADETFQVVPEARHASGAFKKLGYQLRSKLDDPDGRQRFADALRSLRERRGIDQATVASRLFDRGDHPTEAAALREIELFEDSARYSPATRYVSALADIYDVTIGEFEAIVESLEHGRSPESATPQSTPTAAPAPEPLVLTGRKVLDGRAVLSLALEAFAAKTGIAGHEWCERAGVDPRVWDALVAQAPVDRSDASILGLEFKRSDEPLLARQLWRVVALSFDELAAEVVASRVRFAIDPQSVNDLYPTTTEILERLGALSYLSGGDVEPCVGVDLLARAGVETNPLGQALRSTRHGRSTIERAAWNAGIRASDWAVLEVIGPDDVTLPMVAEALGVAPQAIVERAGDIAVPRAPSDDAPHRITVREQMALAH